MVLAVFYHVLNGQAQHMYYFNKHNNTMILNINGLPGVYTKTHMFIVSSGVSWYPIVIDKPETYLVYR